MVMVMVMKIALWILVALSGVAPSAPAARPGEAQPDPSEPMASAASAAAREEVLRLRDRLSNQGAEAHFQLALCAESNGLVREYHHLLLQALRIDPSHDAALAKRGPTTFYSMPKDRSPCKITHFPAPIYEPAPGFHGYGVELLHEMALRGVGGMAPGSVAYLIGERWVEGPQLLLAGSAPRREVLGGGQPRDWSAAQLVVPSTITWLSRSDDGGTAHPIALPSDPVLTEFRRLYLQVIAMHQSTVLTSDGLEWVVAW